MAGKDKTTTTGGNYGDGATNDPSVKTGPGDTFVFQGKNYNRSQLLMLARNVTSGNYAKIKNALIAAGEATKNTDSTTIVSKWYDIINNMAYAGEHDLDSYLKGIQSAYGGATGGGAGTPSTGKTISVTDYFNKNGTARQTAKDALKKTLSSILGRTPTEQELKDYAPVLTEMQDSFKSGQFNDVTTQVYDPKTKTNKVVTQSGFDPDTWLSERVQALHVQRVSQGLEKAAISNVNAYKQVAADYGVNVMDDSPNFQNDIKALEAGTMTIEQVQERFKNSALGMYPQLKTQLDAGLTLRQVAAPAISAIGNILERDTTGMSMADPMVQKYLQGADGKGLMPMYKYESMLRQDPSWQFTKNARTQFADLASFIGQKFGMNA